MSKRNSVEPLGSGSANEEPEKDVSDEDHNKDETDREKEKKLKLQERFTKYLKDPTNCNREDFQKYFKRYFDCSNENAALNDDQKKENSTVLHEVAKVDKNPRLIMWLLKYPFYKNKIDCKDKNGNTPLHGAAASDNSEVVKVLLKSKAKVDSPDKWNQIPLHLAARFNSAKAIDAIMEHAKTDRNVGNLLEVKDRLGQTPLFLAAVLGRKEAASCLVHWGADPSTKSGSNEMCLTYMIETMENVALEALCTPFYSEIKPRDREEWFHLDRLEDIESNSEKKALLPLDAIIFLNRLKLIKHPVIKELIRVKWEKYGRFCTYVLFLINLIYCSLWTVLGTLVRWYSRPFYIFPQDGWRVFLYVFGSLWTIYYMVADIIRICKSVKFNKSWFTIRQKMVNKEIKRTSSNEMFIKELYGKKKSYRYMWDYWTFIEWVGYFGVITNVATHIADTTIPFRQPPCCPLATNVTCDVLSTDVCLDGYVNNTNLSAWNNRIFVGTLFLLWFRLIKYMKAMGFFGAFIAMLRFIMADIFRFLGLYVVFFIPFVCSFWMVFGEMPTIPDFFSFDRLCFTLYRVTFIDKYPVDEMLRFDIVMAYILVGTFLAISAFLLINLLIALFTNTFRRIYNDAAANSLLERAKLIITVEEEIIFWKCKKRYESKITSSYKPYKKSFSYAPSKEPTEEKYVTSKEVLYTIDYYFRILGDRNRREMQPTVSRASRALATPSDPHAHPASASDLDVDSDLVSLRNDMNKALSTIDRMNERWILMEKKLDQFFQVNAEFEETVEENKRTPA